MTNCSYRQSEVAYAAAIQPKNPYSVKARFWGFPNAVYNNIELIYDRNLRLKALADEVWEKAMSSAHQNALANMIKSTGTTQMGLPELKNRFRESWEEQELDEDWKQGHFRLGGHPQGFYTIWVSTADLDKLKSWGYPISTRNFPTYSPSYHTSAIPKVPIEETNTTIKKLQIIAASNWPRSKTQSAVMGNVSATIVST